MHRAHRHAEGAGVLPARRDPAVRPAADGEVIELLVIHGAPGIGKETVSTIVASRLGWPRLSHHDACAAFAPVFGWGTPELIAVRDEVMPIVISAALELPLDGIVLNYTFDWSVSLVDFDGYAEDADLVFVGLTCDRDEHAQRAASDGRGARGKRIAPEDLLPRLDAGEWRFPRDLPGESHVIDTTGRSPEDVADEIVGMR